LQESRASSITETVINMLDEQESRPPARTKFFVFSWPMLIIETIS